MLSWLLLAIVGASLRLAGAAIDKTHGVHPALLNKYTPLAGSTNKWTCLDGSKTIPWDAVNDDYCDCPDGSDEPGTSACPNGTFYCRNEGHIGATIRSSRVNDGLCEPECCDGTDERSGTCPNICDEVGKEHRARVEAENKIRKTGSKIRSSYIAYANKEKRRLEDLVISTSREVAQGEREVERLKDIMDRTESTSAAVLEHKMQSPLFQSLAKHSAALKGLKREHNKLVEKEKILSDILFALRAGYNPNYQDMAVLEAVRGYEHYAKLLSSNERDRAKQEEDKASASEEGKSEQEEEGEELGEDEWSNEQLEDDLDDLLSEDHVSLLLEHDQHIDRESTSFTFILFDVESYIPDAFLPQYEILRDSIVAVLEKTGIVRPSKEADDGAETSKARTMFQNAEQELNEVRREKESAQLELARLYDPAWYGSEGEWKKLDGHCLSKDTGEYTYEVCLFGEAKQKPNNGGSYNILGKFEHWNTAERIEPGSPEYYSISKFTQGARCWNGPERSVTLKLSCGTENAIHSISEPEKCEYHITGTSPAICRAPETDPGNNGRKGKEEL